MGLLPCRYRGPREQVHCPSRIERSRTFLGPGEDALPRGGMRVEFRERVWGLGWTETTGVKKFGAPPPAVFLRAPTKVAPRSVQGSVSAERVSAS